MTDGIIDAEAILQESLLSATAPHTAFRLIRDEIRNIRQHRRDHTIMPDELTARLNRIMVLAGGIAG